MRTGSSRALSTLCICAAFGCALYFVVTDESSAESGRGRDELVSSLFSWSNDADDGVSVLHGEQHGVTRIISGCDADDPACTYHIAPNHNYQQSFWSGPAEVGNDKVSIQVANQA